MKNKIKKLLLCSSVTIIFFVLLVFSAKEEHTIVNLLCGIFISMSLPQTVAYVKDCFDNSTWKEDLRTYLRKQIITKEDMIRISFAYLYRIQVDGKYFLVKNGQGTKKYQPVGGAYKMKPREKIYLKNKYKVAEDNKIKSNETSKNDYRLFVPPNKLRAFVRRFDSTKDRESSKNLGREFKEEIIDKGFLEFDKITYRYCGRHVSNIGFSRHFQCYEILLADIFELLLDSKQEVEFRKLMRTSSDEYRFATEDEILHCGIKEGTHHMEETIGDHTFKILQNTENRLNMVRRDRGIKTIDLI